MGLLPSLLCLSLAERQRCAGADLWMKNLAATSLLLLLVEMKKQSSRKEQQWPINFFIKFKNKLLSKVSIFLSFKNLKMCNWVAVCFLV
jgi:hypothetical protein